MQLRSTKHMQPVRYESDAGVRSRLDVETCFILVACVLVLLLAGTLAALRVTRPSDGARLRFEDLPWRAAGLMVTPLVNDPAGLLPRDLVIAVDGRSLLVLAHEQPLSGARLVHWHIDQAVSYTVIRNGHTIVLPIRLQDYPLRGLLKQLWGTIVALLVALVIASFVFAKQPRDQGARTLFASISAVFTINLWTLSPQVSDLLDPAVFWLAMVTPVAGILLLYNAALRYWLGLPNADTPHANWLHAALCAVLIAAYSVVVLWPGSASAIERIGRPAQVTMVLAAIYATSTLAATLVTYRTTDTAARRHIRGIVTTALICGTCVLVLGPLPIALEGHPLVDRNILALLLLPVATAFALAIRRYHLFGIDIIINRSLVYAALTAMIVGIYILVVGALGRFFAERIPAHGNLLVSLVATGLVAILFQPLRERLQHSVNRLIYGERDDPYAVLARLGQRLEATLTADRVLHTIVETIGQALKLPYVTLSLREGDTLRTAAAYGVAVSTPLTLPLAYQGEMIGCLALAPRVPGEAFSPADRRLLFDLVPQVEIAVHAVRLTADLQRSRERLVTAREEERRQLRRDLHDGLGPLLASLTLKLDAARNLLRRDPRAADRLLLELKAQTQGAIGDIRRLVYALRPPALDNLGLVSALREQARHYQGQGLRILVEAPAELAPLPAAIEVAVYRIALEAMTYVVRHGTPRCCVIRLARDEALTLEIVVDGMEPAPAYPVDSGLYSMRERAAELGGTYLVEGTPGGIRMLSRLPLASVPARTGDA